jgi:hypothetical protein
VVDHYVAERADRIVEVAAVLDAEALSHGDLDRLEVVPAPDRLQHGVCKPEMEDLLEAHLSEVMVDAVELGLVDVLVDLVGERGCRFAVVAERLLDHDTRGLGQAGLRKTFNNGAEEERRNLEVEDGGRGAGDRVSDALVGRSVGEVAAHVRQPFSQAIESLLVELLSSPLNRFASALSQLVVGPVVDGNADDRAVKEPPGLESIQRAEGHHLRQVACDAEHDEDVCGLRARVGRLRPLRRWSRDRAGSPCHLPTSRIGGFDPSWVIRGSRHPSWVI